MYLRLKNKKKIIKFIIRSFFIALFAIVFLQVTSVFVGIANAECPSINYNSIEETCLWCNGNLIEGSCQPNVYRRQDCGGPVGCLFYPPGYYDEGEGYYCRLCDGEEVCMTRCNIVRSTADSDCSGDSGGCCLENIITVGSCPGEPEPEPPACSCNLQNLTCPATCQRNSTFQISYETKGSLASGCYVYQVLIGHQYSPPQSWAVELWCNDDIYYGNTNWNLQTKTLNCNDMINTGFSNLKVECYGDNDDVFAGGQWCDGEPPGGEEWRMCKVDGICSADDIAACCGGGAGIFNMPDANSTTGAVPGSTCQGANFNSCWGGPTSGFSFPDTQAGELYNDNCCGDDLEEYFVSDFGVFQAGSQLSNEDRSCDGSMACCRSSAGVYTGYVNEAQCVASCGPASVGYIKVYHSGLGVIKLNLIPAAAAVAAGKGTIKVARFNGDVSSAAELVELNDAKASPVRVRTPVGIKSWARLP